MFNFRTKKTALIAVAALMTFGVLSHSLGAKKVNAAESVELYNTGFEDGFTASTNYQSTATSGPTGQQWKIFRGAFATTGAISGSQSAQMRGYANVSDKGTLEMLFDLTPSAVSSEYTLSFLSKVQGNIPSIDVEYSIDAGTTWLGIQTTQLTTAATPYTYVIDELSNASTLRFKFTTTVNLNVASSRLYIDDVKVTYKELVQSTKYTTTFDFNYDSIKEEVITNENIAVQFPADPIREGYHFLGWFDNPEGTGERVTSLLATDNKTLYASWYQLTVKDYLQEEITKANLSYNWSKEQSATSDSLLVDFSKTETGTLNETDEKANAEKFQLDTTIISGVKYNKNTTNTSQITGEQLRLYKSDALVFTSNVNVKAIKLSGSSSGSNAIGNITVSASTMHTPAINNEEILINNNSFTLTATGAQTRVNTIEIILDGTTYTTTNNIIRFGALINYADIWSQLGDIQEFGVMVAKSADLDSTIKESYLTNKNIVTARGDLNAIVRVDATGTTESENGEYVIFNARIPVPAENITTELTAAAYVKIGDEYLFLQQRSFSVKSLAQHYLDTTTFEDVDILGSLTALAKTEAPVTA